MSHLPQVLQLARSLTDEELCRAARAAFFELSRRAKAEPETASTLEKLIASVAIMGAETESTSIGGELREIAGIVNGEPAALKSGIVGNFCQTWLTIGAYEVAGGFTRNAGKAVPVPDIAPLIAAAEAALTATFGDNWDECADVATTFQSLRRDFLKLDRWERRKLVRDSLKSGAKTLTRQAAKAGK